MFLNPLCGVQPTISCSPQPPGLSTERRETLLADKWLAVVPAVLHLAQSRDSDWKDGRLEFLRTDIWLGVSALRKRQDPPQARSGSPPAWPSQAAPPWGRERSPCGGQTSAQCPLGLIIWWT